MIKNFLAAVLSVPLAGSIGFAQDAPAEGGGEAAPMEEMSGDAKKMSLGADGAVVIPLGDFSDVAGVGIGALLKFGFSVSDAIMITARTGYIFHLTKTISTGVGDADSKVAQIPFMVGGKYMFGAPYVAAELGMVNFRTKAEFMGVSGSDSSTKLAFGIGGGYMMGDLDFRLAFNMIPGAIAVGTEEKAAQEIMLNVGYDFAHF